jgi:hypothetical protein
MQAPRRIAGTWTDLRKITKEKPVARTLEAPDKGESRNKTKRTGAAMLKLAQVLVLVAVPLSPSLAQVAEGERSESTEAKQDSKKENHKPTDEAKDSESKESQEKEKESGVDTEHIFGFTEGSDIGEKGEKEIDHSSYIFTGKPGRFFATLNETAFRYGIDDGFRASLNLLTDYHGIYDSPGLPDRRAFAFSGLSSEFDWALLKRDGAPFGLTLAFTPQWRRLDDTSGARQESFAFPLQLLADVALSPGTWYAAANLNYAPEFAHAEGGSWTTRHEVEMSTATALAVSPDVFVGGEVRHLTQNQRGFFTEHGLFVGPSLYVKLGENTNVKLAWSAQIPDETTLRLDLVNYERHQLRVQFATGF